MKEYLSDNNSRVVNTSTHNQEVVLKHGFLEDKTHIAVLDLELTCWDQADEDKRPQSEAEITEIGIVIVNLSFIPVKRISLFVKPEVNSILTPFCTTLTGITQAEVDQAGNLEYAMAELKSSLEIVCPIKNLVWCAWGKDLAWLKSKVSVKHSEYLDPRVLDLSIVAKKLGLSGSLSKTLKVLKLPQVTPVHRALPDAESTLNILKEFKLEPIDAFISNERTYRQAAESAKDKVIGNFTRKVAPTLDGESVEVLLKCCGWNFQKAATVYKLFNKS